jgi:hypothetical protein
MREELSDKLGTVWQHPDLQKLRNAVRCVPASTLKRLAPFIDDMVEVTALIKQQRAAFSDKYRSMFPDCPEAKHYRTIMRRYNLIWDRKPAITYKWLGKDVTI